MSETATAEAGAQAAVQAQVPKPKKAAKSAATSGNLIQDIASEVENLTKTKALNRADLLVKNVDDNYFELGGILGIISRNQWYEGTDTHGKPFESFGDFVRERFGFEERKAFYLIKIYDRLVINSVPWEKVKVLGWTKLKDLAGADKIGKDNKKEPVLTADNADEWVEKGLPLTVAELQKLLKIETGVDVAAEGSTTVTDTAAIVVLKFRMHPDNAQGVQQAINKAKGEIPTKYDAVALESICLGYLGDNTPAVKTEIDLVATLQSVGADEAVKAIDAAFPLMQFQMAKEAEPAQAAG